MYERDTHLPTVRMPRKLEVHRVTRNTVGIVGLMNQQDCSFACRNVMQSGVKIDGASNDIVHSAQPEPPSVAFNRSGLVRKHLNSLCAKRARHSIHVSTNVVVPHHCPKTMRRLHLPQELRARFSRSRTGFGLAEVRYRYKVAGEHNQLGTQSVHHADRSMNRMDGKIRIVVKVAEHSDGETIEQGGPTSKTNVLPHDSREVGLNEQSVRRQPSCTRSDCEADELSPVDRDQRQSVFDDLRF